MDFAIEEAIDPDGSAVGDDALELDAFADKGNNILRPRLPSCLSWPHMTRPPQNVSPTFLVVDRCERAASIARTNTATGQAIKQQIYRLRPKDRDEVRRGELLKQLLQKTVEFG
jgi:hypothetical protein